MMTFDFGGHSLLATRIIGNLLINMELRFNLMIFKSPSAADLAQYALVKSAKTENYLTKCRSSPAYFSSRFPVASLFRVRF